MGEIDMFVPSLIPYGIVLAAIAITGIIDAKSFRIPNAITIPLLISGIAYHTLVGGLAGFQASVLGALLCLGMMTFFYLLGMFGAGDVKLMAAVGAWFQAPAALIIFAMAAIGYGIYSFVLMVRYGSLAAALSRTWIALLQLWTIGKHVAASEHVEVLAATKDRRQLVPFAVMVALAVFVIAFWAAWPWGGTP
jgi:prepilin peptidase CpaA